MRLHTRYGQKGCLRLPSPLPHPPVTGESEVGAVEGYPGGPRPVVSSVVRGDDPDGGGTALAHSPIPGGAVAGGRRDTGAAGVGSASSSLAPERDRLMLAPLANNWLASLYQILSHNLTVVLAVSG